MQIVSSGFLIRNVDGLFLCGKPSNNPFFTIPKGQLNEGEDVLEAAYRETLEESGLDLKNIDGEVSYIGSLSYNIKKDRKTLHVYYFKSNVDLTKYEHKCSTFYLDKNGVEKPELETYRYVNYNDLCGITYKSLSMFLTNNKEGILNGN